MKPESDPSVDLNNRRAAGFDGPSEDRVVEAVSRRRFAEVVQHSKQRARPRLVEPGRSRDQPRSVSRIMLKRRLFDDDFGHGDIVAYRSARGPPKTGSPAT